MKLTFVYKKADKVLEFTDIQSVKTAIPDADIGFLYYVSAITLNEEFRGLIKAHREEFGIPMHGFNYTDKEAVPYVNFTKVRKEDFDKSFKRATAMLNLYEWTKLDGIHMGYPMEKVFPYLSLFNRVPVLLKTHVSWSPNIDAEEDDDQRLRRVLKSKHRFLYEEPEDESHSGNLLHAYENELLHYPYFDKPFLSIQINIDSPISLNKLTKYLKQDWEDIEHYLFQMKSRNDKSRWKDFRISERDMKIVDMHRYQGMTFAEIGNSFTEPQNSHLYEDSVKTAYHRAAKKIDGLILPEV